MQKKHISVVSHLKHGGKPKATSPAAEAAAEATPAAAALCEFHFNLILILLHI